MKVLVLGAGGAASNGFCRALRLAGGYELVGTNCNRDDLWLSECEENYLLPHVRDYDDWRRELSMLLAKTKPDFVHAQSDPEVYALGLARTIVHLYGAKTFLPAQKTIGVCQDKWASYQAWKAAGVPVPKTRLASSKDAISSMIGLGQYDQVWMRPRKGAGGQKSFVAHSYKEAAWWLDRNHGWDRFTVAEMLTDQTVTVQFLYWRGELVCSQQRSRESWANAASTTTGVSGSTGVGVTTSDPLADEAALHAVDAVDAKPHGLYGVDMARNAAGIPCVTEINIGRFFTTAPEFYAMAGFNMAAKHVDTGMQWWKSVTGTDSPPNGFVTERNPIADGYRWVRGMDKLPVLVPTEASTPPVLLAAA